MNARPFRTRIRAVRLKSGGEIRLLLSQRERTHRKLAAVLEEAIDGYLNLYDGELAGFSLVVWGADGTSSAMLRNGRTSPMNSTQLPSFLADRVRRQLGEDDAAGVVRDMLGMSDEKA